MWLIYKKIYPIHKKLESILTNDTETLFLLRQTFFPPLIYPKIWESERVNDMLMRACWIPSETRLHWHATVLIATTKQTRCKDFRWSRSPALNMITVEQLLVFDPVSTTTIYSRFNGHRCRHHVLFAFDITSDVFPCMPSEDNLTQATASTF